jgi:lipid II:glycine glycyltransferase (peptidoglycan interpeptide bridge formation enzyme)
VRDSPTRGKSLRQKLAERIALASERKEELISKEREKIMLQKQKWETIKEGKLREWHMYGNLARKKAIKKAYIIIFIARQLPSMLYQNFVEARLHQEEINRCIRFCKTFPSKARLLILKRG